MPTTAFTPYHVLITVVLLAATFAISRWLKLGIETDLGFGIGRSFLQLIVAGYVLEGLFRVESLWLVLVVLLVMVMLGAHTSSRRSSMSKGVFLRAAVAIGLPGFVSLGILLAVGIIPWKAGSSWTPDLRYLIPIAGIVVGNSMQSASVAFERFSSEMAREQSVVEAALTLGASRFSAVWTPITNSIRSGLIPAIDRMKVMGAVVLPGAAVGMIIAGADPFQAIFLQLIVAYSLLFSRTCAVTLAILLVYPLYFSGPRLRTELFVQ